MNSLVEMYNSRPVMTLLIAGTALVIACDLVYEGYTLFFGRSTKPRRKKRRVRGETGETNDKRTPEEIAEVQLEARKPTNLWNTVLFFPDYTPEAADSTTRQLIHYFESARMSIHICMYLASHPALGEVIRKKYCDGLLIQVVTDYDTYTAHNNCGVKHWKRTGIEVRMKATGFLMHHKFAVIDEEALLTGSLNWTKQGLACNQENVMVTTDSRIVKKYMDEFITLWQLFAGEDDC